MLLAVLETLTQAILSLLVILLSQGLQLASVAKIKELNSQGGLHDGLVAGIDELYWHGGTGGGVTGVGEGVGTGDGVVGEGDGDGRGLGGGGGTGAGKVRGIFSTTNSGGGLGMPTETKLPQSNIT